MSRMLAALAASALLIPSTARAQHEHHQQHPQPAPAAADPHAGHQMDPSAAPSADPHAGHRMERPAAPPPAAAPPAASTGPEHAADTLYDPALMAEKRRAALIEEHGGMGTRMILLDRLEYRAGEGSDGYGWDAQGWTGGDYDKLWVKTEGEGAFGRALDHAELQMLYGRAIGPWFDVQAGLRQDLGHGPDRTHVVLGIQGLAPYWFELDAALFLSTKGELTARIEAEYDQRITNRLILQPAVELGFSARGVPSRGVRAGLDTIEAGLRLRYEFVPEFAPYIGVAYIHRPGRANPGSAALVTGLRAWF